MITEVEFELITKALNTKMKNALAKKLANRLFINNSSCFNGYYSHTYKKNKCLEEDMREYFRMCDYDTLKRYDEYLCKMPNEYSERFEKFIIDMINNKNDKK